jgi:hypothetical protein
MEIQQVMQADAGKYSNRDDLYTVLKHYSDWLERALAARCDSPAETYVETLCRECGQPTMHIGTICYTCAHKSDARRDQPAEEKEVMNFGTPVQLEQRETAAVAPPPVSEAGGDMHTNPENVHTSGATCIDPVPLPEPDCGSILVGRKEVSLGHSDEAMIKYAERVAAPLRDEINVLQHKLRGSAVLMDLVERLRQESVEAERERDEARRDAERYRWLRDQGHKGGGDFYFRATGQVPRDKLDEAIDSAMVDDKHTTVAEDVAALRKISDSIGGKDGE